MTKQGSGVGIRIQPAGPRAYQARTLRRGFKTRSHGPPSFKQPAPSGRGLGIVELRALKTKTGKSKHLLTRSQGKRTRLPSCAACSGIEITRLSAFTISHVSRGSEAQLIILVLFVDVFGLDPNSITATLAFAADFSPF